MNEIASVPAALKMGFSAGQDVQELGWDEDVDQDLRTAIEEITGKALLDADADEEVDTVILWWRAEDGDLVDGLVDALTDVKDGGYVWLLTPKPGRPGHIPASDIDEAAPTAGYTVSKSISAAPDWNGIRLTAPRNRR